MPRPAYCSLFYDMKEMVSNQSSILTRSLAMCLSILLCAQATFANSLCKSIWKERDFELTQVASNIRSFNLNTVPPLIFARILRGNIDAHFQKLSTDAGRDIVMLMDAQGILETFGRSGGTPPLEKIGYTRDYIKELVASGTKFKLILIKGNSGIRPATWKNLGSYLKQVYGSGHIVNQLFAKHYSELQAKSFSELSEYYGPTINKATNSKTLTAGSSLWEFRSFLYNELRLTELYTGNGFTQTPDGQRGLAEYFIVNSEINEEKIGPHEIVDINP